MKARDVATRMRAIEDNIESETRAQSPPLDLVVSALLGIDYEGLDDVLEAEAARVVKLMMGWYAELQVTPKPANIAALGFVQGVTFAVAAQRLWQAQENDA